jgi:hypothetical protein
MTRWSLAAIRLPNSVSSMRSESAPRAGLAATSMMRDADAAGPALAG